MAGYATHSAASGGNLAPELLSCRRRASAPDGLSPPLALPTPSPTNPSGRPVPFMCFGRRLGGRDRPPPSSASSGGPGMLSPGRLLSISGPRRPAYNSPVGPSRSGVGRHCGSRERPFPFFVLRSARIDSRREFAQCGSAGSRRCRTGTGGSRRRHGRPAARRTTFARRGRHQHANFARLVTSKPHDEASSILSVTSKTQTQARQVADYSPPTARNARRVDRQSPLSGSRCQPRCYAPGPPG
jgi:hypothetical protein